MLGWRSLIYWLGCAFLFIGSRIEAEEKPFVVVIPSYNNSVWCEWNLSSVFSQNYENFRVIFIDDASTDGMAEKVVNYIAAWGWQERVTFLSNRQRRGALANIHRAVWLCTPEEIIVQLDGDDFLNHPKVLSHLNEVYADPDVWVTYGQFVYYPSGDIGWAREVPADVIAQNAFREYDWVTTHLRTFYAGLFHKIKRQDLLYNGDFYPMAGDLAWMWPILEMAGTHSRFIADPLYIYNFATEFNDQKTDPQYQFQLGLWIRTLPKYTPVERPYD